MHHSCGDWPTLVRAIPAVLLLSAIGCSHAGGAGESVRPKAKTAADVMGGEIACAESANKALRPLVVDLSGADRLDFEAQMGEGVAIVSYTCEGMRLLPGCSVSSEYSFVGVSLKEENFQLESADEVAANIPLSGASVGAGMKRDQSLDLAVMMVGKVSTPIRVVFREELVGACEGATHSVRAATVGAFAMHTGTKGKVQASAALFGAGVDSSSESSKMAGKKDGDPNACKAAKPSDANPPDGCRALVRLELMPIQDGKAPDRSARGGEKGDAKMAALESPCPTGFVLAGGKCTQDTQDGDHLCNPSNLEECRAQCDKGNADSCYSASTLTRDAKLSSQLCEKACEGGSMEACTTIAVRLSGDPGDHARAKALATKACEAGVADACIQLTVPSLGLSAKERMDSLERACLLGQPTACEWAAKGLLGSEVPRAQTMLNAACMGGDTGSCETAVSLYMGEKVEGAKAAGKKDEDRARKLAIKGCQGGSPVLCQRAARMLDRDSEERMDMLRAGCRSFGGGTISKQTKDATLDNCSQLRSAPRWYASVSSTDRLNASSVMCELAGGGNACVSYELSTIDHAVELLKKACEEGDADACVQAPHRMQEASCYRHINMGIGDTIPEIKKACDALAVRDPVRLRYLYQLKCSNAGSKPDARESKACREAQK